MLNIKTDFKTHIIKLINEDQELKDKWNELSESAKDMLRSIDSGERTPNLLRDIMFKSVFNPEIHPDWLSKLIGAILGRDVRIIKALPVEGIYISEYSKGVLFDIMVEFGDGDIDYSDIHPVYTIVIMEESSEKFKVFKDFHHHFEQKSNTGLDLEFIQYYDYICLDVFRENKPHTTEKLIQWIDFLSITDPKEMEPFLIEHPEFVEIYSRACEMLADREGLLNMLAELAFEEDVVGIIKATNEGRTKKQIKKMEEQLREKDERIRELEAQLAQRSKE